MFSVSNGVKEFGNRNLAPLKEYLDNVSSETPHQYFSARGGSASGRQDSCRMSEIKSKLDKSDIDPVRDFCNFSYGYFLKSSIICILMS